MRHLAEEPLEAAENEAEPRRASRAIETEEKALSPAARIWSVIRSTILGAAAALGVICVLAFGVAMLFGIKPLVVFSGSMEPTIPTGSVVFEKTVSVAEANIGDIVTVPRTSNSGLVTHRMVVKSEKAPGEYELELKGDANAHKDPKPYTVSVVGKYLWHVPWLGNVALALQDSKGIMYAGVAALVLIAVFLFDPAAQKEEAASPAQPKHRRRTRA
jgi:signal peptidase